MSEISISEVDNYFMGKEIQRNNDALIKISSQREIHDEVRNQIEERVNEFRSNADSGLSVQQTAIQPEDLS